MHFEKLKSVFCKAQSILFSTISPENLKFWPEVFRFYADFLFLSSFLRTKEKASKCKFIPSKENTKNTLRFFLLGQLKKEE